MNEEQAKKIHGIIDEMTKGSRGFVIAFNYDNGKFEAKFIGPCEHCVREKVELAIKQAWINGEITQKEYEKK